MKTEFDELVKRAKKGDSEAFSKLYAQIYKELYYYALCNLDNSYDAADAVSDAVFEEIIHTEGILPLLEVLFRVL